MKWNGILIKNSSKPQVGALVESFQVADTLRVGQPDFIDDFVALEHLDVTRDVRVIKQNLSQEKEMGMKRAQK